MIRESMRDVTALRSWNAASLRTILPLHSTTPSSPILSIPKSNIRVLTVAFHFRCTSYAISSKQGFVPVSEAELASDGNFRELVRKICATAIAVSLEQRRMLALTGSS
jgi:hypothetical protein